ncbi:MAG: hypothetical protein H6739_10495 [Alphaproteobacteria bacterium]|nr:hypothetical protein [Alphaproteobacteria bacterium]
MTRTRLSALLLGLTTCLAMGAGCGDKDNDTAADDTSGGDDTATAEVCDDGADNDGDGATDCDDSDCVADPACVETDCADGADNDGDGATDCDDSDCATAAECQTEDECADGVDNDQDGVSDCLDEDCDADAACTCVSDAITNSGQSVLSGTTEGGSDLFPSSEECGSSEDGSGNDYVFAWAAPDEGCWNINTDGSDFDTILRIVSSCDGEELDCNDDSEFGLQSSITVPGVPGHTYLISVDGYGADDVGSFVVNIGPGPLGGATDLGDATGASVASGDNSGATAAVDSDCGSSPGASVIFAWTAPSTGDYTFDTYGSDFDTILGLWGGDRCQEEELTCDDDGDDEVNNESEFTATVEAGTPYFIVLSGYSAATGNYILNINEAAQE